MSSSFSSFIIIRSFAAHTHQQSQRVRRVSTCSLLSLYMSCVERALFQVPTTTFGVFNAGEDSKTGSLITTRGSNIKSGFHAVHSYLQCVHVI